MLAVSVLFRRLGTKQNQRVIIASGYIFHEACWMCQKWRSAHFRSRSQLDHIPATRQSHVVYIISNAHLHHLIFHLSFLRTCPSPELHSLQPKGRNHETVHGPPQSLSMAFLVIHIPRGASNALLNHYSHSSPCVVNCDPLPPYRLSIWLWQR